MRACPFRDLASNYAVFSNRQNRVFTLKYSADNDQAINANTERRPPTDLIWISFCVVSKTDKVHGEFKHDLILDLEFKHFWQ